MADFSTLLGVAGLGGAIGKAIVQLELDTAKYQAEMAKARAQTESGTLSMGQRFAAFGGLAKAGFAAAGIAAVAFGAVAVKAAIEANEAHLKLQNTFENQPRLSDSSVEAFERQADALRDLTGVDDEAIVSGQALLGQFKLTGDQVQEITPLVVDLSAKMGIDLEAAFKAVGKATQGSAGILSRYGIVLDEDKLKGDAFGTTLKGLGVAAGFAEERADAEPWRKLGAQFEEIAEMVGQKLLPVLQDFANWLNEHGIPIIERAIEVGGLFFQIYSDIAQISFAPQTAVGDVFRELGGRVDELNVKFPELNKQLEQNQQKADIAASGLTNMGDQFVYVEKQVTDTGEHIREFANMTGKELKEWRQDTKSSFREAVLSFDDLTVASEGTTTSLVADFQQLRENAQDFRRAMRELSDKSHEWIPEKFREYLSTLGPADLIDFANANERQQHRMIQDWRAAQQGFNDSLGTTFLDLKDALDDLDKKTTNHKVIVSYEYRGFDPSKPGMQGSEQVR